MAWAFSFAQYVDFFCHRRSLFGVSIHSEEPGRADGQQQSTREKPPLRITGESKQLISAPQVDLFSRQKHSPSVSQGGSHSGLCEKNRSKNQPIKDGRTAEISCNPSRNQGETPCGRYVSRTCFVIIRCPLQTCVNRLIHGGQCRVNLGSANGQRRSNPPDAA